MENKTGLRILWMIPKWTLPAIDGARVATDSLIRSTVLAGACLDVLCLSVESENTDIQLMRKAWNIKYIYIVPRKKPQLFFSKKIYFLKQLFTKPLTPLTFSSFADKFVQRKVKEIIENGNYDFILLDGLHLGMPIFFGKERPRFNSKIIYRAHNIEADLWKKAFKEKKNPILKAGLYFQSFLVRRFENCIIMNSDGVAAISKEDLIKISKIKNHHIKFVPLGLNFDNAIPPCKNKETKFLFIGRLDWPPNKDGLKWLLNEVWPSVMENRPGATLKIVGSGNCDWLQAYKNLPGIESVGFIPSLSEAYRDCDYTLVPIFYGSGTRIKVLESFAIGRKLISTKMGVQGVDLESHDYINAETKEEWINFLTKVKYSNSEQSQLELSCIRIGSKFGEKEIGAKFYNWLKTFL